MTVFLGIETSCDETAAAVVSEGRKVLSSTLYCQTQAHQKFGGVVPEIAAREHLESINLVVDAALSQANATPADLSGIACTRGPGLIGTLLVGMAAAKTLSFAWDLPLICVDHLLAHVCANYLESTLEPPFVALLASGGHTQITYFSSYQDWYVLGQTLDDAAGEAFDKVARLIGLGYPGGPALDRIAADGNPDAFKFPEGVVSGFDFSFSGLKTAVLRCVEKLGPPLPVADLAASFQESVVRSLVKKTIAAQKQTCAPQIVLAGGVSANSRLRAAFTELSPVPVHFPALEFCTDNAAMVASAAYFCGTPVGLEAEVYSRQPRDLNTVQRV